MTSSYTANKDLEKPGNGDYANTWNVPLNGDMTVLDYALGYTISFNATAGSKTLGSYDHTTKALDTYSYIPMFIKVTGAVSADVTYTIPSGVGGQWIVYNTTTDASGGPHTVTFASGGGGSSVLAPRNARIIITSDGTNVTKLAYPYEDASGNVEVTGSITAGTNVIATSAVTAGTTVSDSIGNLREVPANSQTGSYVLQATDSGKYISITTGGVTVPQSIFTTGQVVSVYNDSGSAQTITAGSGVTLRLVGTTTTGNRSIANYGLATILCVSSNTFVVTGGGIS